MECDVSGYFGAAGMRHGSNPGTVVLDGQKVPIRVPRVRSGKAEIPLRSYQTLHGTGSADEGLLRRVLYGISCRNYEAAARSIPGAIGLSSSSVSRGFIEASAAKLKEFQERDLKSERCVALFLDGKSFADALMVIALGVTADGSKRFLGFVESDTENHQVLVPFLNELIERGLDPAQRLLVVIDGGKGLRSADDVAPGSRWPQSIGGGKSGRGSRGGDGNAIVGGLSAYAAGLAGPKSFQCRRIVSARTRSCAYYRGSSVRCIRLH